MEVSLISAAKAPSQKTTQGPLGLRWRSWYGLLLVSPWLLGFILLKLVPILVSLGYSFTNFDLLHPNDVHFIGFFNYILLLHDNQAVTSLIANLGYTILAIPAQLVFALGLASLVSNPNLRGRQIARILFFMPAIVPGVAIFSIWTGFLDPTIGWVNHLLMIPLGLPPSMGIRSESGFISMLILMTLWSIGPSFYIMLGAMNAVPTELYESARVDGAGPITRFFQITLPMISPAVFFSLVINLISMFGGAALLDPGNTYSGGLSIFDNYISQVMFDANDLGYASALAWVFFIIMLTITYFIFRSSKNWVYYAESNGEEDF
jgi:ABC-type sugar transport system permease subunit